MCHTLPRIGYKIPYNKNIKQKENDTSHSKPLRTNVHETRRTIDFLVTIYEDYLSKHNLPEYDASDMLHAHHIGEIELHDSQIGWFNNFIRLWDFVAEAEYQKLCISRSIKWNLKKKSKEQKI